MKKIFSILFLFCIGYAFGQSDLECQNYEPHIPKYALDGNLNGVKCAITLGGNINEKDSKGRTALILASYNGNMNIVKFLVQSGANADEKYGDGQNTALTMATYNGKLDIVKYLIEKRQDSKEKTEDEQHALMIASYSGKTHIVEYLLEQKKVNINHRRQGDGLTPLMAAVIGRQVNITKHLIREGANINLKATGGAYNNMNALDIANDKMQDKELKDNERKEYESIVSYLESKNE